LAHPKKPAFEMLLLDRREELARAGGVPADVPMHRFTYMDELFSSEGFLKEFDHMQSIYIFDGRDNIPVYRIKEAISDIREILKEYDL